MDVIEGVRLPLSRRCDHVRDLSADYKTGLFENAKMSNVKFLIILNSSQTAIPFLTNKIAACWNLGPGSAVRL